MQQKPVAQILLRWEGGGERIRIQINSPVQTPETMENKRKSFSFQLMSGFCLTSLAEILFSSSRIFIVVVAAFGDDVGYSSGLYGSNVLFYFCQFYLKIEKQSDGS